MRASTAAVAAAAPSWRRRLEEARLALDPDAVDRRRAAPPSRREVEAARSRRSARPTAAAGEPARRGRRAAGGAAARASSGGSRPRDAAGRLRPRRRRRGRAAPRRLRVRVDWRRAGARRPRRRRWPTSWTALEAELVATAATGGTPGTAWPRRGAASTTPARRCSRPSRRCATRSSTASIVDRLEQAHADLLDAIEKADGRFGGARAQRRVAALRAAEQAVLDELGFTSYSDYMMGYSLLHVDPAKEAALDAARAELAAAEDAWRALQAETDAELARAEPWSAAGCCSRRPARCSGARSPPARSIDELRALRVAAEPPADRSSTGLQRGARRRRAWRSATRRSTARTCCSWPRRGSSEAAIRRARGGGRATDLRARATSGAAAAARAEAAARRPVDTAGRPERPRVARLDAARGAVARAAEDRRRAHAAVEAECVDVSRQELADGAEAERPAAAAAADAERRRRCRGRPGGGGAPPSSSAIERDLAGRRRRRPRPASSSQPVRRHDDRDAGGAGRRAVAGRGGGTAAADAEAVAAAAVGWRPRAASGPRPRTRRRAIGRRRRRGRTTRSVAEEVEWYLLARLAAQRSVSLAGSLPLLLDDALGGLDEDERRATCSAASSAWPRRCR